MNKLKTLVFFILISWQVNTYAQYSEFLNKESQIWLLNPAETGNNHYEWSILNTLNAKQLVNNNLNTLLLAADYSIYFLPNKLSLGVGVLHNNYQNSPLQSNLFILTGAFERMFNKQLIRAGITIGFNNNSLQIQSILFPDQYDRNIGGFNSLIATQDVIPETSANYFDLNFGIVYQLKTNSLQHQIGISLQHINHPDISYNLVNEKLNVDKMAYYNLEINLQNNLSIKPLILIYSDNKVWNKTIGSKIIYGIRKHGFIIQSLIMGADFNMVNEDYPVSAIFQIGTNYNKMEVKLFYNYFITTGDLVPGKIRTVELSILFRGFNYNMEKYSIPCEMF